MALPAVGLVSYNGVTFGVNTTTNEISGKPVYDAAGRTIVHVVYVINIKTIITNADAATLGTTIEDVRRRLQTPGGELHYESKGFGTLAVNPAAGGGVRDVVWGPKPTLLRWRPLGDNKAVEIVWSCDVAIPECDTAAYQFRPMEFVYKLSWTVDKSGYTKRIYSGYLVIPQTRGTVTTRSLSDQADSWREAITPQIPFGFRRVQRQYSLNESKCRLEFSIEDEELPAAPPPGIVECSASHVVNQTAVGGYRWAATLSAEYEVAKGFAKAAAFDAFQLLFADRISEMQANGVAIGSRIVTNFTFAEPEIYGRKTAAFAVTYTVTCDLTTVVAASGLWRPVPGTNWQLWATSLTTGNGRAMKPRGNADMAFTVGEDSIIDLCIQPTSAFVSGAVQPAQFVAQLPNVMRSEYPPPEKSWMHYRCRIRLEVSDENFELKTIPVSSLVATNFYGSNQIPVVTNPQTPPNLGGGVFTSGQSLTPPAGSGIANTYQTRSNQSIYVTLHGEAIRAGYPMGPPVLTTVNGVPAVPANRPDREFFDQTIMANWGGVPVVGVNWQQRYMLPSTPVGPIGVPTSPLTGIADV